MSGPLFFAVRFGSTAFDVLVAVTVLQRLSRAGGVAAPLVGAVGAGSAFLIKLVPWSVLGLGVFGIIHLAYLDLIAVPSVLVVAGFALARRRGVAWARGPVAGLSMGLAASATPLVGAYASFVEPFDLGFEVTRIPVTPERQPVEPLRIGVLADIQTAQVAAHRAPGNRRPHGGTARHHRAPRQSVSRRGRDIRRSARRIAGVDGKAARAGQGVLRAR